MKNYLVERLHFIYYYYDFFTNQSKGVIHIDNMRIANAEYKGNGLVFKLDANIIHSDYYMAITIGSDYFIKNIIELRISNIWDIICTKTKPTQESIINSVNKRKLILTL